MKSNHVYILGVNMSNHDRSACLLKNGEVLVAISEERLDRRKKSEGFYENNPRSIVIPPLASITYVLQEANISLDELDLVVCGRSINSCKNDFLSYFPIDSTKVVEIPLPGHHLAHAYSAIGTAPFKEAAILVIDEQGHHLNGNFEKCSLYHYTSGEIQEVRKYFGNKEDISLGMFYDIFASLIGLSEAGTPAAGKLMGLAPYGNKREEWPELITLINGDTYISLTRIDNFLSNILPIRKGMEDYLVTHIDGLLKKYIAIHWDTTLAYDLAYKAQEELERAILYLSTDLLERTSAKCLCYAGGVALNCTANGKLLDIGWEDIFVHPAATDDGNAIGLALYGWHKVLKNQLDVPMEFNPFLGKKYKIDDIMLSLKNYNLDGYVEKTNPITIAVDLLLNNKIICWFQGQSEWGPRALGARSILANPLMNGITKILNSKIKLREHFRPLGISGTEKGIEKLLYTDNVATSLKPYMLAVGKVKNNSLDEIKHKDDTVRFQVVNPNLQPNYYKLIREFGEITGIEAVINTSFNVLGEPLVESPNDAVRQFLLTEADVLIIDNYVINRENIPTSLYKEMQKEAFNQTYVDKLKLLLNLEYLGYEEKADNILSNFGLCEKDYLSLGASDFRSYCEYMLKLAVRQKNFNMAENYAKNILEWSAYSKESATAIEFLVNYKNDEYRDIAYLINQIAPQGEASNFFRKLLSEQI
ncbi:carbamoyltransferase C-terminal domain-containing protein [Bacillus paranthracis]|uniref:carbamoyltransferase C-terminal domain-containing protein n=1 Tax=Bacillus cereus group TaxID=86661 RepID=UPI0022E21751|nr:MULTISPECIES: carbamoyltransferase C-terminal domain-containing protein [Bacillus cereus group]MBL3848455.1 nodulation protein-related protein [Bacillus cereus]MDA1531075.1 hypothetical protein [Bacillus cereus group sp. TH260-2LC]MDZ4486213.1 hypothetical protein [Bacillus cereus]